MTTGIEAAEAKTAGAKTKATKKATKRKRASKPREKKLKGADNPGATADDESGLSTEALTVVGSRASRIVEQMLFGIVRGDSKTAQMLVELAKTESEAKEALRHGPLRSQALAWAAEPQWQDEVNPEQAETVGGSREAE